MRIHLQCWFEYRRASRICKGLAVNKLGEVYGLKREVGESNAHFRLRILLSALECFPGFLKRTEEKL